MTSAKDYYEILGVSRTSDTKQIKRAYRDLVRKYHPDSAGDDASNALFQLVTEAYTVLSDSTTRAEYDRKNPTRGSTEEQFRTYRRNAAEHTVHHEPESTKGFAGPAASRFTPVEPKSEAGRFTKEIKERWGAVREAWTRRKKMPDGQVDNGNNVDVAEFLRGERIYQFSIDALESLRSVTRHVALNPENAVQNVVSVTIPPCLSDGAVTNLSYTDADQSKTGTIRGRVRILPHPLVERDGLNIILHVPFTVAEAIRGIEFEVPTLESTLRVKLPPQHGELSILRVANNGILDPASKKRGDLLVKPHIVLPDMISTSVEHAADAIEAHYQRAVRSTMPRRLT